MAIHEGRYDAGRAPFEGWDDNLSARVVFLDAAQPSVDPDLQIGGNALTRYVMRQKQPGVWGSRVIEEVLTVDPRFGIWPTRQPGQSA